MAARIVTARDDITAPSLLGMHMGASWLVAAGLIAAMVASIGEHLNGIRSVPLLALSMAIAAVSAVGVVAVRADPMPLASAWTVAAMNPVSVLLTCLAVGSPLSHPNQTNVFGVGVIVGAFLCVRGRTRIAWIGVTASVVIMVTWSASTGLGPVYGIALAGTAYAVIGMAAVFSILLRPAAETINSLRRSSIDQTEQAAASEARIAERDRQRDELLRLASPTLTQIVEGRYASPTEKLEITLMEAQLRDGIGAKSLKVPSVIAAARGARARGVKVVMVDGGGMDRVPDGARGSFCANACEILDAATSGTVTVRVNPPHRATLGSTVVEVVDGRSFRVDVGTDGARIEE